MGPVDTVPAVSTTPPDEPWGSPGPGSGGTPPPPPPPGEYPPPGGYGYPPPPGGGYPGGGYPGGGYPPPGGGYPGGGYPPPGEYYGGGYGNGYGGKGITPFGPATSWGRRAGATIVDGLVLLIPNFIVSFAGGRGVGTFLSLAISAAYATIMLSRNGQTVGNMAVGTRVIDARTGGPISAGKAFGRWAFEFVLLILFVIPWVVDILWPLWDSQNQTLHDKMAGTLVVRTA